jgi:hypothetical protein
MRREKNRITLNERPNGETNEAKGQIKETKKKEKQQFGSVRIRSGPLGHGHEAIEGGQDSD